jgi:LPPG:FO 2-phospho-L-lactate transferase
MKSADLVVIVNTGDDFEHLGLFISPDLDTVMYTLAGLDDPNRGWGRREETWTFMSALARLSEDTWFSLGDGDLATHVERTRRLRSGEKLSGVTGSFCRRLGILTRVLPMSDDTVQTRIETDAGPLSFQDYFVRRRCAPAVRAVRYEGAATARAHPSAVAALRDRQLRAVVICPSNPLLSIAPMLALAELRETLAACAAPVVAVSPIIAGRSVKGPTAKMMAELKLPVSAVTVARQYAGLIDGYVLDEADAAEARKLDVPVMAAKTLMETLEDREALARAVLAHADAAVKPR